MIQALQKKDKHIFFEACFRSQSALDNHVTVRLGSRVRLGIVIECFAMIITVGTLDKSFSYGAGKCFVCKHTLASVVCKTISKDALFLAIVDEFNGMQCSNSTSRSDSITVI